MPIHQNRSTKKRNRDNKKVSHQKKRQIMKTNRQRSSISLIDLPLNVLVEILARLPLRTLFIVRSVCKTFISLTTKNPHFINLHSSNVAQITVFHFERFNGLSCLIHMTDQVLNFENSQLKPLFQLPKIPNYFCDLNSLFLVNSCNGLLYFCQNGPDDYLSLVCNPVTSEYIIISDPVVYPKMRLDSQTKGLWLGFSYGTNQYKVIRIFCGINDVSPNGVAAQVFVVGSDSWRDVADTPPLIFWDLFQTQYVNGLMYWHDGGLCPSVIISFDFEREKFRDVVLPPEFQEEEFMKKHETTIGVLGGCLCLSCNSFYAHRVDLWVMRMCGNRESWTKEFVVDTVTLRHINRHVYCQFKPLQILENGEILMQWRSNFLVCYDPRTEILRYFRLHRGNSGDKVVALTPSFVPLKVALKVEKVLTRLKPWGDEEEL